MGRLSRFRWRPLVTLAVVLVAASVALAQFGGRFRRSNPGGVNAIYEPEMQDPIPDPPNPLRPGEFELGRLRFPSPQDYRRRRGGGYSRWGIDANKGDRLFISILSRLTRIDAAPIETITDVDEDTMFDHPFLFAVSVGDWQLSQSEADRLGQFLKRGGFLMVDDFHNPYEWATFWHGVMQMDPNFNMEEMQNDDPAFHTVYDLSERIRVSGRQVVNNTQIERGGIIPHWRAIRDENGRMVIEATFNQDIGDGWEFADDPYYPERVSSEAMRLGVNYVIYAMTR